MNSISNTKLKTSGHWQFYIFKSHLTQTHYRLVSSHIIALVAKVCIFTNIIKRLAVLSI